MNQPWGLSGPQFLLIYGAGMAAFAAAPWLLVLIARAFGTASARVPAPVLDAYQVGYLAGGAQRAAEVVIGELTTSGALRVDSVGQISQASPGELAIWLACAHGIAAQAVPDGLSAQKVQQRLAKDPGIAAIGVRLRAERLLIARSWVIAARVTAWALWLALMVAGALRMAEGVHNHHPIGDLAKFYVLTVLLGIVSRRRWLERLTWARTRAGAGYLKRLEQREVQKQVKDQLAAQREAEQAAQRAKRKTRRAFWRAGTVPVGGATVASMAFAAAMVPEQEPTGTAPAWPAASLPGLTAADSDAALLGIALAGLAAVEDPALRTALLAGMPSSGGGGGCGGGGCGGGCGG